MTKFLSTIVIENPQCGFYLVNRIEFESNTSSVCHSSLNRVKSPTTCLAERQRNSPLANDSRFRKFQSTLYTLQTSIKRECVFRCLEYRKQLQPRHREPQAICSQVNHLKWLVNLPVYQWNLSKKSDRSALMLLFGKCKLHFAYASYN